MKALEKSIYRDYEVSKEFNQIILNHIESYYGNKKERLKSFIEDLLQGGCVSGMISEFIYHIDCRNFYVKHLDDLEDIRKEIEEDYGVPVTNSAKQPHYTFMCWLCFEQYCYNIYSIVFED